MGIAGRHLLLRYGAFRSVKVRLASPVIPGQTLQTEMWKDRKEPDLVVFQMRVLETGALCIVGRGVKLRNGSAPLEESKL